MKESTFQNKIIRKLRALEKCYVVKIWGGGFQSAGVPDLLVCYRGYFIAIELKNEIGRLSELQKVAIEKIEKAEGIALVLRPQNENELWELLKNIDGRETAH